MTIHNLPNIGWSPGAALVDASEHINNMDIVTVIWTDKDGRQHSRSSGTRKDILWVIECEKHAIVSGE